MLTTGSGRNQTTHDRTYWEKIIDHSDAIAISVEDETGTVDVKFDGAEVVLAVVVDR
jgi:hypothetical protein